MSINLSKVNISLNEFQRLSIGEHNAGRLAGLGLQGIAVVSAILASEDIAAATARLRTLARAVTER